METGKHQKSGILPRELAVILYQPTTARGPLSPLSPAVHLRAGLSGMLCANFPLSSLLIAASWSQHGCCNTFGHHTHVPGRKKEGTEGETPVPSKACTSL